MRHLNKELIEALENVIEAQRAALLGYSTLSGRQDAANWSSIMMGGVKEGLQEMADLRNDVSSRMESVTKATAKLRAVEVALADAEKEAEADSVKEAKRQEANTKAIAVSMAGPDLSAVERSLGTMSKAIASLRGVAEAVEEVTTEVKDVAECEEPGKIITTTKMEPKKGLKPSGVLTTSSESFNPNKPEALFLEAPIDITDGPAEDIPLWLVRAKEEARTRREGKHGIKQENVLVTTPTQRIDKCKQQAVKPVAGLTLFMPPYKWDTLFDVEKEMFSVAIKCLTETPTFKELMSAKNAPEFKPYIDVNGSYSVLRLSPKRGQWILRLSGASNNRLWRSKATIVTFNIGKKHIENVTDTDLYISPRDKKPFPLMRHGGGLLIVKVYDAEHVKSLSDLIEKSFINAIQCLLSPEVLVL